MVDGEMQEFNPHIVRWVLDINCLLPVFVVVALILVSRS